MTDRWRPARFRMGNPDGSLLVELDEAETDLLYRKADKAGVSPAEWLSRRVARESTQILAKRKARR